MARWSKRNHLPALYRLLAGHAHANRLDHLRAGSQRGPALPQSADQLAVHGVGARMACFAHGLAEIVHDRFLYLAIPRFIGVLKDRLAVTLVLKPAVASQNDRIAITAGCEDPEGKERVTPVSNS